MSEVLTAHGIDQAIAALGMPDNKGGPSRLWLALGPRRVSHSGALSDTVEEGFPPDGSVQKHPPAPRTDVVGETLPSLQRRRHLLSAGRMASSSESNKLSLSQIALDGTHDASSHIMSGEPQLIESGTQLPKQITHLIDLTDQVLTKHTQMQHEEETLDRYQTHLNACIQVLMVAFTDTLHHIGGIDSKKKKKKRHRRSEKVPEGDSDPILVPPPPPPPGDPSGQEGYDKTSDAVLQTLETEIGTSITTGPIDILWERYRKYQNDYEALHLQRAKVTAFRNELTALEYRLRRRLGEFKVALETMSSVMGAKTLADASNAMGSFTGSEKSKSETPTLLATCFDCKGHVGVYRDRLIELDYHFQEGQVDRDFIVDRGDDLEISDELFDAEYRRARKAIENDLKIAEQEAAELAGRCHAAGIDIINTTRKASSSTAPSSQAHSVDPLASAVSQSGKFITSAAEGS